MPNVIVYPMRTLLRLLPALLLALATPAVAHAHAMLKRSQPSNGDHLAAVPRELRLDFTEALELSISRMELRASDGTLIDLSDLTTASDSRRSIIATIEQALNAGTYTVAWRVAGADGHPMHGSLSFTIAPGATGIGVAPILAQSGEAGAGVLAPGQVAPPRSHHNAVAMPSGDGFDAESPAYVVVRWLLFTGLVLVIGAVAFRYAVLGFLGRQARAHPETKERFESAVLVASRHRVAKVGLMASIVVAVAVVLRLIAQSYAMHGAEQAWNGTLVTTMLGRTLWGWGWALQLAGVIVAAAGFATARRRGRAGWPIAALGAVMLAFTPALSGHAASAPRLTELAVVADGFHVMGAGGWLGSLLMLVVVGIPVALTLEEAGRGPAVALFVNAFSPTALVFAGISGATGVFAAWLHLGTVPALWQTPYGKTLLVKLAILSVVGATGVYNWLRVKPSLGNIEGATRIRRSAVVELAVGVLVLIVTAVLVATPTAMDVAATHAAR